MAQVQEMLKPIQTDWLSPDEAAALGGNPQALISRRAIFYGGDFKIGSYSRLDAGCIVNGDVEIGELVHIAPYCILYGKKGISIGHFSVIGPFSVLHTEVDNFDGTVLCGALWPEERRKGSSFGRIRLENFSSLGTRTTIFAGVTLAEGAAVGAHSLVREDCLEWSIYAGTPARRIKARSRDISGLVYLDL